MFVLSINLSYFLSYSKLKILNGNRTLVFVYSRLFTQTVLINGNIIDFRYSDESIFNHYIFFSPRIRVYVSGGLVLLMRMERYRDKDLSCDRCPSSVVRAGNGLVGNLWVNEPVRGNRL